ncbi:hypothetical protein [Streptomyces sp. NPDC051567]|uniref:hypothetical protein n=1 Tax=Streptomyces sp. NPDC051567 TaxID=3365660 RepID=UPI0037BD0122
MHAVPGDGAGTGRGDSALDDFVALSAGLTGFTGAELHALGVAREYLAVVLDRIGADGYARLAAAPEAPGAETQEAEEMVRAVIHLWYTGSWPGLRGGAPFVVSSAAYAAGLVWRAAGVPAPGTVSAGFGSWSGPPASPTAASPTAGPASLTTGRGEAGR